ncbi:MAG TPA: PQQ-dependent sugar dehydrogenase [Trueperaceae bacterium]|nr:PQQ-dependent sugar dehydrogenase [Trueperaceae bacterium]
MKHLRLASAFLLAIAIAAVAFAQDDASQEAPNFENLTLELVAEGFVSPVALLAAPGDDRLFVVDRPGQVIALDQDGQRAEEPFLDIADRIVELDPGYDERGLLGFAFHPDFAENGRAFAYYSAPLREEAPEGWNHTAVLSEFTLAEDGSGLDPDSERILLEIDQPQMNHNGGQVLFGHDGYLYLGLGDGGGANDVDEGHPPLGNGQDVTTLKGSVLRLDVDVEEGYGIPDDNPFAGGIELPDDYEWSGDEARAEIYLWGLRNPYRFSVDRETGALLIPDVGQNLWEEVNHVTEPGNLGWNQREGAFGFDPDMPEAIMEEGPTTGPLGNTLVEPVLTYAHPGVAEGLDIEERGISVSGGYVYRGSAIPELVGYYVFGDWSQSFNSPGGKLFVASTEETGGWEFVLDRQLDEFVLAFGEDDNGELYVLTTLEAGPSGETGKVYRIVGGE